MRDDRWAFTLAEVLITLGIIGVVAALTMPSLINNTQDKQFKAKWKKAFAMISSASYDASDEYDSCEKVGWQACNAKQIVQTYAQILSKLELVDACHGAGQASLYDEILKIRACGRYEFKHIVEGSVKCKSLSGDFDAYCDSDAASAIAILKDGVWLYFAGPYWDAPKVLVDVNGPSAPNTIGRDMFVVKLVKNKAIPCGAAEFRKDYDNCRKDAVSKPMYGNFPYATDLAGSTCSSEYLYK